MVWTDLLQTIVIFVGLILLMVFGCQQAGGITRVWNLAYESSRLNFFEYVKPIFLWIITKSLRVIFVVMLFSLFIHFRFVCHAKLKVPVKQGLVLKITICFKGWRNCTGWPVGQTTLVWIRLTNDRSTFYSWWRVMRCGFFKLSAIVRLTKLYIFI